MLINALFRNYGIEEKTVQTEQLYSPTMATELELPQKHLQLSELSFLDQLGRVEGNRITLERSFRGYNLKTPVALPLERVLSLGQKGLALYIVSSLISQRPKLIPWVLDNRTVVEMARYLLRARSASKMGFYGYTNTLNLYCRRLNTSPDRVIDDVKAHVAYPDPAKIEKHRGFLQQCIEELQERNVSPGRIGGYSRQIRTFYHINGVELPKPKYLPRPRVVSKHRAPTIQELRQVLGIADLREKLLILLPATSGFREGTLSLLRYAHVKEDLEKNVTPAHVHIEPDETKGQYTDYDTFISSETVEYLKLYLDRRIRGSPPRKDSPASPQTQKIPPEKITDKSPLIRDSQSTETRPIGEKQIYRLAHNLFHRAGLTRKNKHGGYELTFHSLRTFFKTEMKPRGVSDPDLIDYWMGHTVDVYNDIQSRGIEYQRGEYAKANLRITPEATGTGNIALFKKMAMEMTRELGVDPEQVLARETLAEPHRIYSSPEERDELETRAVIKAFAQHIKEQLKESSHHPSKG